jgi:lipid II:glycine glycyltransferase (peptidoglycan interpeptide bridge formation enzyme)
MILVKKKKHGLPYTYLWFAEEPTPTFMPRIYMNSTSSKPKIGYVKRKQFTKIIDLKDTEESIFSNFGKNATYKIKRAIREGVDFKKIDDIEMFIDFYNTFAIEKGREKINQHDLFGWNETIEAYAAVIDGTSLVMHSYLTDPDQRRVRLLHSASQFRGSSDSKERNFIGRANRFLHYKMMIHYKDQDYHIYDLGGYAKDTTDRDLAQINNFKDEFGGSLLSESMYISYSMWFLRFINRVSRRMT